MTKEEVMDWLDTLRDEKDFDSLKELRNYLRQLIATSNKDWFED